MAKRDPYRVLGVSRSATDDEIKKAYRRLARQHHPDVNNSSKASESRFKEVQEAYQILSDPQSRRAYDMFGDAGIGRDSGGFKSSGSGDPFGGFKFGNSGFNVNFGNFSGSQGQGIFGDIFSELFRQGGARSSSRYASTPGQDVEYNLTIDFDHAYHGTSVTIRVLDKKMEVHIPAGVDNGSRIRVAGQGAPGIRGGPPGDLYLTIRVNPSKFFARDGLDIHLTVPISFGEAVLGAKVEVPGPSGRLALKIPPATQSGTRFRFGGKGFAGLRERTRGDFYVTVHIVVPETLDPRSRELVEEFQRRNPFDPRRGW